MKTRLARPIQLKYLLLLYWLGLLALVSPSGAATSAELISGSQLFRPRIVQVGPTQSSELEAQLVWQLMETLSRSQFEVGLNELEQYLQTRPTSPWAPALDAALGKYYHDTGRDTLALEHWELAWAATKAYRQGNGKSVADFTLAHWTRLLASLGRYETLAAIFQENRDRVLDRGSHSQMWARTREAFVEMRKSPGISYQCGTFALNFVAREMQIKYDARTLLNVPSPTNGFSLRILAELSTQLGLGLVAVVRTNGQELVVPAVVHWRQNHYAAIVARRGNFYKVIDPTFGRPRYMTAETINAEASGNFLVPLGLFSANYRLALPEETDLVFGRGNPNYLSDLDDQCCECGDGVCPPGGNGPGAEGTSGSPSSSGGRRSSPSCSSGCSGMAVWHVSEPYVNLWLEDEPLGYQPALGARTSFTLKFKQRAEAELSSYVDQFSSVGLSWNCSWLSTIHSQYGRYGWATVYYAGGGVGHYDFGFQTTNNLAGNYYNNLKLFVVTNVMAGGAASYELRYPSGAKDIYGFNPTNEFGMPTDFYLSQKISPEGQTTTFQYENYDPYSINIRLKYVIDSDGHTNTLSYATSGYSTNLITQVTDPYGRAAYLGYDTNGLLNSITDVIGLNSAMAYNELGWVTNLTTPYGQTSFALVDKGLLNPGYNWDRSALITEANTSKQLYAFVQFPPFEPGTYPDAEIPTNTPIGTLDNGPSGRNSYYWGRQQTAALTTFNVDNLTAGDYLKARMRHWLGGTVHGEAKTMDTLSLERAPSPDGVGEGQKTWYDYPNKATNNAGDQGDHILPGVIARVLPDGSTWYSWSRRNLWGAPTNTVETYTKPDATIGLRTNVFVYTADGLDLTRQLGPNNEQVVSNYFGTTYHQPDTSYDALNQETRYTYNANRQLTSRKLPGGLTTTNIYFSSGPYVNWLDRTIDLEIKRTNAYTYANGLVYSHTDERKLIVTNYWDNLQRLTATKYPDGTTVSNFYTALDLTATKDRLGLWTYAGFNGIRQKIAETNANNVVTRYGYCECGALLSVTNAWNTPAQMVTGYGYDNQGNRLYTYYPDATVTNWFDSLQRVIITGDAWAYRWFGYNNQGLLTSITNAFGPEQLTTYDLEDQPIYVTDANNVTVTNTYDDLGRLRTRTAPDGGAEKFGYSARGLIAYTNQLSFTNFYAYDEAGRKTFETNANWELIRYTNTPAGDLQSLTDGKNQTTKWNYDEYGRVTNKLDQAGAEILRYTYDAGSRLASRWSAAKGTTYYTNDAVGNLTKINYPVSPDITYQYDALNRMTNMVDAAGTTAYSYAVGGQLWTEDGPWASDTVTNTYNNRMRTGLNLAQPTGQWTSSFGYDAAKRLTNATSPAGAFSYTLGGASAASSLPKKLLLPNTSYITNTYDNLAQWKGTYLKTSGHVLTNKHEYAYNAAHQRINSTNLAGTYYTNTYDRIGQLKISDSSVASEDRGYMYDAAWNLNKRTNNGVVGTFTVDNKNQLVSDPATMDGYDANGNLTMRSGGYTYSYDDENQLTSLIVGSSYRSDFNYDGRGRLRVRTDYVWTGSAWTASGGVAYIYDGMRVIQERSTSNTPTVSYTRGTDLSGTLEGAGGIGGLLGRSHGYVAYNGTWTNHNFYHADGNGNVTYMLNSSQTKVAEYRYDPFGNTIAINGSLAGVNLYRFSSKETHVNSGMYYYGYRFYDPNLQRWPNRDPFADYGFQALLNDNLNTPDNGNLYGFVNNAPTLNIDAFGLATIGDSCLQKQKEAIKNALKKQCDKAKECAKKCPHSKEAADGVAKICDGNYTINCVHKDNEYCKTTGMKVGCGYAPVGGNELNLCPSSFDPKSPCGKNGPGCTMFHESLHSGGLTHGPKNPEGQKDFDALEKCMGCQ